jgi:hypothetical protein
MAAAGEADGVTGVMGAAAGPQPARTTAQRTTPSGFTEDLTRRPGAELRGAQGEVDAFGLALGDGDVVAVGDGHGVAEALAIAVPDALADGDGVGVGVGLGFAVAEPDGVGVAAGTQKLGAGVGASSVRLVGDAVLLPPSSSSAAGTTNRPTMTVTTKASAPHSWSQKPRDELRIRALRPSPVGVCCAC